MCQKPNVWMWHRWHKVAGTTKSDVVEAEGLGMPLVVQGGWDHKPRCGDSQRTGCGMGGSKWL